MFYNLVKKNSKRNRKENGLFFSSLIVSIIAFYVILSLGKQDVILFLREMESDAINKLFLLIPLLYGLSLFILFFLVYFAGKYQLERRSHELGMYLMLGMKRSKLYLMLLAEEVWNSILSLAVGIPIAIFLSEIISLITAKTVGLGVIGHKFSFSLSAVIGTILGYFVIRCFALLILSGKFSIKEITELLSESQQEKHRKRNRIATIIQLILGVGLLGTAYTRAIKGDAWEDFNAMGITIVMGIAATFLLFRSIGILFEILLIRRKNKNGLGMFTFRQLQESIFIKPNALAISSLLVMMALCCFGYGVSVGYFFNTKDNHVIDYTFDDAEEVIKFEMQKLQLEDYVDRLFEMKLGRYFSESDEFHFSAENLIHMVEKQKDVPDKDILLNNLQYFDHPYLISLSSYNQLLVLSGKEPIKLSDHQVALYSDPDWAYGQTPVILGNALKEMPYIEIGQERYELVDKLYQDNIVTDRFITISYGLIVSDELFQQLANPNSISSYWNATLKKDFVEENGLMQAISKVNALLNTTQLHYESYLQNMGRELFYSVAASYTTIYLAVIFLIIANTVIGVQFLMQQQKTKRRYQTLISLGGFYKMLCKSARQQITWYFSLPVVVAAVGSIFGVRSLFTGITTSAMRSEISSLMIVSCAMILLLCVVEFCYMLSVKRISDKSIEAMMEKTREDS